MHGLTRFLVAAAVLLTVAAGPALAQDAEAALAMREQCREDALTLCDGIRPGGGRIGRCLYSQRDRLSDGCRMAVKVVAAQLACAGDYLRFCNGVPRGEGRILSCLKGAGRDVSRSCREKLGDAILDLK